MTSHLTALRQRLVSRTATVGVIGLGYVGLPLARGFVGRGFRVLGFDADPSRLSRLRRGEGYIGAVPDEDVRGMLAAGFEPADRPEQLSRADALVLCVPTPLTAAGEPDLSAITEAGAAVAAQLRPVQLVVLTSTTYPGTTRDILLPLLVGSGLIPGEEFFLAYSPEREDPGNATFTAVNTPRVVGALDPAGLELAATLFQQITPQVVRVSSAEVAEACKLLENTYRAVNIALVNEMKVLFDRMGIDVWEVIDAAKTKPFGFQAFSPGPGVGGNCIPVNPSYLTWVARRCGLPTRFIEAAVEVNAAMPGYVASRVAGALNAAGRAVKGSRVLLLGIAYKKDIDDARESPGIRIMDLLRKMGAEVRYHDPLVLALPGVRSASDPDCALLGVRSETLSAELLHSHDAVVIVTDHTAFDWEWVVSHARLVVDTRNATRSVSAHRDRIIRA